MKPKHNNFLQYFTEAIRVPEKVFDLDKGTIVINHHHQLDGADEYWGYFSIFTNRIKLPKFPKYEFFVRGMFPDFIVNIPNKDIRMAQLSLRHPPNMKDAEIVAQKVGTQEYFNTSKSLSENDRLFIVSAAVRKGKENVLNYFKEHYTP